LEKTDNIKEVLEAELQEAREKQKQLQEQLDDKPDFGLGQGSTGAANWEMNLARKNELSSRIEELEEALAKLEEGTYGICENCGKPIDPERLEILPTTKLCAECA
jgi:RNA polymerase-binding transcription factor DksA